MPRCGARNESKVGPRPAALKRSRATRQPQRVKRGWQAVGRVRAVVPPERAGAHSETGALNAAVHARDN